MRPVRKSLARMISVAITLFMVLALIPPIAQGSDSPFGDEDPFFAEESVELAPLNPGVGRFTPGRGFDSQLVEPFGDDPTTLTGTRNEICGPNNESENRPGRIELAAFFLEQWSGLTSVGGFACREIDKDEPPCDGQWYPAYSTCWSTHAAGRALDLMVCSGCPLNQSNPVVNQATGDSVVNWLLAEQDGYVAYNARAMGVMQILWHDRCWQPSAYASDQYVTSVSQMRQCGIADHDNHPHLTLTDAGADGQTSWFEGTIPPPATVFHDWDGDGANDVIARSSDGKMLLYRGTGTGTFVGSSTQIGQGWNTMTWILSPGDWDGDGNNDVVARRNDGTLRLYPGTGTGTFVGSSTQIGNGWNSMSALVAPRDWDGDGNNDLLGRQTDGDLFLYRGNGSGGFIGSATQIGNGWHLMVDILGPGDWDGDGNNDLIARRNDGNLWLYPGNGSGGFNTAIQIGNGWSNMTWILAPGDWNGDGNPDLIARHSDGKMWLYKGNGTGGFINPPVQIGQGWGSMTWLIAG